MQIIIFKKLHLGQQQSKDLLLNNCHICVVKMRNDYYNEMLDKKLQNYMCDMHLLV